MSVHANWTFNVAIRLDNTSFGGATPKHILLDNYEYKNYVTFCLTVSNI
jgi:hypothetical protein